jgi:hypothetical protein
MVMFNNVKIPLFVILSVLSFYVNAEEYSQPILKASEVVDLILEREGLKKEDVKVILLRFDYLKSIWHVELVPANEPCIDCYPSFYIQDSKDPKIEKLIHG